MRKVIVSFALLALLAPCPTARASGDCGCAVTVSGDGERPYTPCEASPIEVTVTATATCGSQTGSQTITLECPHDGVNPPAPRSGTIVIADCRQPDGTPCGPHSASYSVWFTKTPSACRAGESGTYESEGGGPRPSVYRAARAASATTSSLPRGTPGWQVGLGGDSAGNASGFLRLAPEVLFGTNAISAASLSILYGERRSVVSTLRVSDFLRWDSSRNSWIFIASSGAWRTIDEETMRRIRSSPYLRQVRTKECLVQINEDADSLSLAFYAPSDVESDYSSFGFYKPVEGAEPFATHSFTRPAEGTVRMTETRGGGTVGILDFVRRTAADGSVSFSVVRGGGLRETREVTLSDDGTRRTVDTVTLGSGGFSNVVRRTYLRLGGRELLEGLVEDPGRLARTTRYVYGTDSAATGSYGRIVHELRPEGLAVSNAYDAAGNIVETREWILDDPSAPVRRTVRSYAPLGLEMSVRDSVWAETFTVPSDDGTTESGTARDETEWVGDVAVSRILRHVTTDGRNHRLVGEVRLTNPAAADVTNAWADAANPFTLTDYMPKDGCKPCSERPSRTVEADGSVTVNDYCSGDYAAGDGSAAGAFTRRTGGDWFRTVSTRYPDAACVPIPGVTVRDVTVEVRSSRRIVLRERWVATGTGDDDWERISWTETFRDKEGNEIATAASDGSRTATHRANGRPTSRTGADGVTTAYGYDLLGRTVREVRSGGGLPDVTVETAYDPLDRVLRRTESAGGLSRFERTAYDALGRRISHLSTDKVLTRFIHAVDAAAGTVSETAVVGWNHRVCAVTNATLTRADGRILAESVNGKPRTTYAYGADADGTQWTRTFLGPAGTDSPRWAFARTDPLGRTVEEVAPGFGGTAVVTSNRYDAAGRLLASVRRADGAVLDSTLHARSADGAAELAVRDIDLDGAIGWTGPDRIASNDVRYVKADGDWWRESASWESGAEASAEPVRTGSVRTRLTGFGAPGPHGTLAAETVATDRRGNATVSRLWRNGAVSVRETAVPGSSISERAVSVRGLSVTNRTAAGVVTSTEYDALGRPVAQFDGRGNRTAYAYDARGRIVSATDAAGNVTRFGYDGRGRRTSVTDPLGNAVATAYDSEGRVLSVRGAAYPVDWGYDEWGDRVSMATYRDESLAQGDVTRWLRDAATGLVTNRVSADGRRTAYAYDALGRAVRRTDARGVVTDYAYDAAGDLAAVSYSDGTPSAAFARDRAGRLVSAVTDGVATNLLAYDAFGAVTNETQNGVAVARTYDGYGRLASMDGAAYGYDALGRLASVESDGLLFTWLRVPGTDLPAGYVCGDFRRTVAWEPKRDLVAAVTNAFGDAAISSFGYGNDAAGRRITIGRGGSAFGDLAGSADSYDYNARSEVVSTLREKNGAEVYGFLEDFAYDPIGNRTESAVYDENGTRHASVYESNERNQYVSRTVPGLAAAWGDADARATVTVNENPTFRLGGYFFGTAAFDNSAAPVEAAVETYAALPSDEEGGDDLVAAVTNRVHVPQSPELFAYDANGNRTVVETPTGRWAVEWNAENRPVRWTCGARTLLMVYDHMGRRVRYVEMTGGVTNKMVSFLYDGHLCIARTADGVTDRFLWDPTEPVATRPLATVADGTPYLYAHDANKNVSELVNARTGEIAAHYDYSSFGRTLVAAGPLAHRNPFRFSSEYVDDATGLSNYNWRHYDPVHGRWLSEDPLAEEGGLNLYGFCSNDSVRNFDIKGWFSIKYITWEENSFIGKFLSGDSFRQKELDSENDIPIGRKNMNLNGLFSAALGFEDNCTAYVLITLSINSELQDSVAPGDIFRITPHKGLGNGFSSSPTRKPPLGAILAHELGHAKAFFSIVRPKFEERISKYKAKGRLSEEEKEMVKMIFKTVMKESEKQSGDQASNDELAWYRRNGFYERKGGGMYEFEKK